MTSRLEPRTPSTVGCPDQAHRHEWTRRGSLVTYVAAENGLVVITEEALADVLRMAGFMPEGPRVSGHGYLGDQQLRRRVEKLRREHGRLGLALDEGPDIEVVQ